MRIETARDTDHRTSPPNFPGQFGLLSASGPGQTLWCSGCDHPPRMASTQGAFAGGRFLGFFWKRPVQVPSTGARGASIDTPSASEGSSARVKQSPKRKRGVKQPGNTEHEKAIRQQRMRNNRPAMHNAPALKRIAGCSLQARRKLSAWRVAAAVGAQPVQQLQTQRQTSILTRPPLNKGLRTCRETLPTTTQLHG